MDSGIPYFDGSIVDDPLCLSVLHILGIKYRG